MAFGAVEKLQILIEANYRGDGAAKARQDTQALEKSVSKLSLEQEIASQKARDLSKRTAELADAVRSGKKSFDDAERELEQYRKELGLVDAESKRGEGGFKRFATAAAGVGAALGTAAIAAKQAYDALKEGAALNTAANQFDILTGKVNTTADALLGRMREASQGFATDAELIASGNQIISLGLAKTEDDVANLAAVIGGLGLDMQQVILTFANNSKARLDSLGLSVEGVNERIRELEKRGDVQGDIFDAAVLELLIERNNELSSAISEEEKAVRRAETAWNNFVDARKRGAAAAAGGIIVQAQKEREDILLLDEALARGIVTIDEYSLMLDNIGTDDAGIKAIREEVERLNDSMDRVSRSQSSVAYWTDFFAIFGDQRNVFNLENTAERLEYLGRVADDSADGNYTYEVSAEQVAAAEEKRAAAHKRVADALQGGLAAATERAKQNALDLAAAAEESAQRMADAFSEFIDSDGETAIEDVNKALYEQIEAAGADAETLAFAGVALGQFTEAQAKAALEQAALNEKLVELGKEVANGNLTIDQALEKFDSYRQGLQDTEAQAQRNKEATIEYTQAINDIPEEKRTELFVEKESAVSAVEDLRRRLDEIPRSIDIDVNVNVPPIPEVYRPGGEQNYDGTNIPARATGGPVSAFQPYIVGERGPEMFVPSQNGTIVPNGAMGNTFNISVNVSAGGGGADRSLIPIVRDGVLEALQRVGAY